MTRETSRSATSTWPGLPVLLLLLLVACGGSGATSPPPAPPRGASSSAQPADGEATLAAAVHRLLDHSQVESIVSGRAGPFTRRVALLAEDLTDRELERLVPSVRSAFSAERLRRDVAAYLEREAPDAGTVREIVSWHDEGPVAEMRRIAEAREPSLSLLEYARSLPEDPPEPERADLMVRWVEAQQAGSFYVLMDQALAEAAHAVWRAFRPEAPVFDPLQGPALEARLAQSFNAAVVSSLHRHQAVPDSVLREAVSVWESDDGQWYVETYSLAVAEAIRSAGERTVDALEGSAAGGGVRRPQSPSAMSAPAPQR